MVLVVMRRGFGYDWRLRVTIAIAVRWHPRFAFVFHALPLCGAAPTFLCRGKEK
jgi:hypothetical protein